MANVETFSGHEQTVILAHRLYEEDGRHSGAIAENRDEVSRVAYGIYESEGGQPGHESEHWARAERVVRDRHTPVSAPEAVGPSIEALEAPDAMVP